MELILSDLFGSDLKMTSREIAEVTGKKLYHVNRDILTMLDELDLDKSKFGSIYFDNKNRQQTEYVLNEELTLTLVTGYSIKLRNAVIKRWKQLENQTVSLQDEINKICAKENFDKAIGSIHGKGLAERKKTKKANQNIFQNLISQAQLTLGLRL
ncbi:Rha family transcriptional regulator [Psychrobacter alimentarius]|uniref:Rha family transcriptional regulator n=1 Tax=Psychrobacter alimentarius TaxID=261164 RepID=UPI003FD66155